MDLLKTTWPFWRGFFGQASPSPIVTPASCRQTLVAPDRAKRRCHLPPSHTLTKIAQG
jgi:hypothetical protein